MNALRPIVTALIGSAIGALAAFLLQRFGIAIPQETQDALTNALAVFLVLAVGGVGKVLFARWFNPTNAAKPSIVPTTDPDAPGPTITGGYVHDARGRLLPDD